MTSITKCFIIEINNYCWGKVIKIKNRNRVLLGLLLIILIISAGLAAWLLNPYQATEYAVELMDRTTRDVKITDQGWIVFQPTDHEIATGFIFYPGARVQADAYTPLAYHLAGAGYQVILVPMPANLAILGSNKADQVLATYQEIDNWVIGGHSLGGVMAARYAKNNPARISGLILLASYPAESDDLSTSNLDVLSIYATEDGHATIDQIKQSKDLLPEDTGWVEIKGGNHSQFGYYGFQTGDEQATISRAEQQQQIFSAIDQFLITITEK